MRLAILALFVVCVSAAIIDVNHGKEWNAWKSTNEKSYMSNYEFKRYINYYLSFELYFLN